MQLQYQHLIIAQTQLCNSHLSSLSNPRPVSSVNGVKLGKVRAAFCLFLFPNLIRARARRFALLSAMARTAEASHMVCSAGFVFSFIANSARRCQIRFRHPCFQRRQQVQRARCRSHVRRFNTPFACTKESGSTIA